MKPCDSCIHSNVCRYSGEPQESCNQRKAEEEALHTLRLIYADILGEANRCKAKAQEYFMRKKTDSAYVLRREGEIRSSCAARIKHYCRMIGFDPSGKGE